VYANPVRGHDAPLGDGEPAVLASWRTDPKWAMDTDRRFKLRYWDGTRWTHHVSDGKVRSSDPSDPSMPAPLALQSDSNLLGPTRANEESGRIASASASLGGGGGKERRTGSEVRCTCQSCGNVWHYGKFEQCGDCADSCSSCGASMQQCGKSMMCCSGCAPAIFIPNQEGKPAPDRHQCPRCGSKAVSTEIVTHEVG
jgi:hypothetical protein